ncbi:BadF/BadG/BcrA/BcrD ATPase family protein [Microvirga antarctica]|uniref:BadF/BadG/BcrA/BcrD ATPase family protein n=1 Tax=Microvirga antarctica TaxID=2819233 RepID=UPI001B30A818|nr:BadF/BadG/BcrA/BcrD ATPase family protein [Microvirga antarctica]
MTTQNPLFLGIDGGGTKCRARLRDASGRLLGEGSGGPANVRLDPALVWRSVLAATRAAAGEAGLTEADWARTYVGMGAAGAGQATSLQQFMTLPHPFAAMAVETDAHTAWLGAFGGKDGAILIIGTGSCGYASVAGARHYVGGWGHEISDEGSGAAIGRDVLRRAIWTRDGRLPGSTLATTILAEFGNSPEALIDWVGSARPGDFARFAPVVLQHAEARDPLALDVIERAAADVSQIALRLLDLGAPALCLFGGLAEPLRPWLPPPVQHAITPPLGDALDGAILLARGLFMEGNDA